MAKEIDVTITLATNLDQTLGINIPPANPMDLRPYLEDNITQLRVITQDPFPNYTCTLDNLNLSRLFITFKLADYELFNPPYTLEFNKPDALPLTIPGKLYIDGFLTKPKTNEKSKGLQMYNVQVGDRVYGIRCKKIDVEGKELEYQRNLLYEKIEPGTNKIERIDPFDFTVEKLTTTASTQSVV